MNEVALKIYKNCLRFILFVASFTLIACADPMLGKKLPFAPYPQFTNDKVGHHLIPFEDGKALLKYDWLINSEENTLTLKGTFSINAFEWEAFTKSPYRLGEVVISAFLLNQNYEIIKVENFLFYIDDNVEAETENEFTKTFPFNKEYKFITFQLMFKRSRM